MRHAIFLFCLALLLSCDRELPNPVPDQSAPVITAHHLPVILNPNKEYTLSVKVQSDVPVPDSVALNVYLEPLKARIPVMHLALYDDGAAVHPQDDDIVAHDGIYTQKMLWNIAMNLNQNYIFRFYTVDVNGEETADFSETIPSISNTPPYINSVTVPDTLPSGFEGTKLIQVSVGDSNGVEDIQAVTLQIVRNDKVIVETGLEPQSSPAPDMRIFVLNVDSTFATGMKGQYELQFIAVDRSGAVSEAVRKPVFIENGPPVLHDLEAPLQIQRPAADMITFYITVGVRDPQSFKDIKNVKMIWQ